MEPIRPDDDELRADAPIGRSSDKVRKEKRPTPSKPGRPATPGKKQPVAGANKRGGGAMLWLVVVLLAIVGAGGWYLQNQRIQALESQLEEADYWARQSKLALARFEGELSQTGENLQERGASLSEQIASNKKSVASANSEIRKLWVLANEKNKPRLDDHEERLKSLSSDLASSKKSVGQLEASLEQLQSSLKADIAALEKQTQTSLASVEDKTGQINATVADLKQQMAEVDQRVDQRIRRFEQEQKLGIDGMESRISALEKQSNGVAEASTVKALKGELSSLQKTVEAIDASRSQLTSRLVRLSDEVDRLKAQVAGK